MDCDPLNVEKMENKMNIGRQLYYEEEPCRDSELKGRIEERDARLFEFVDEWQDWEEQALKSEENLDWGEPWKFRYEQERQSRRPASSSTTGCKGLNGLDRWNEQSEAKPREVKERDVSLENFLGEDRQGSSPDLVECRVADDQRNERRYREKMKLDLLSKAEEYIVVFEGIKQRTGGDDILARSILQEVSKDRRMDEMKGEREKRNGDSATTKQLEFLKKLGVEVPAGITKKQATTMIDTALEEKGDSEDY